MEIKTKQRMIGIAIIAVILLILVPLLFSKSKQPVTEPVAEQAPAVMSESEVAPDQLQPVPEEQPQINTDQQQPMATEQPESGATAAPSIPQNTPQASTPTMPTPQASTPATPTPDQQVAPTNAQPMPQANLPAPGDKTITPAGNQPAPTITAPTQATNETIANPTQEKAIKPAATSKATVSQQKWSVQLGSFSQKNNATKLLNKLKINGYAVHIKESSISGVNTYRVFISNNYDHKKAQKIARDLDKKYHIKGIVVRS